MPSEAIGRRTFHMSLGSSYDGDILTLVAEGDFDRKEAPFGGE